jgi:hypothetical protein
MTHANPSLFRRSVGFSLIVIGIILFGVLIPLVARAQDILAEFIALLLIVSCVALGSFLFLRVGFRSAVKSLLIVLALAVPWFAIFFIRLPGESQLLIATFVALIAILLYRRYYNKRSLSQKTSRGG